MIQNGDIQMMNPLHLAYIGDSVYALMTKERLLNATGKLRALHSEVTDRVRASYQARALTRLMPLLTEEEKEVVRKGRNAHARHAAPKSATPFEYTQSTALEALFGYLYLKRESERLNRLFECIVENEEGE